MKARLLLVFAALIPFLSVGLVSAQQNRSEAFVYGINASVPGAVMGTFAPPSVETIYLMAEETSVLSPRQTLVYFWPISNEFRAAWSEMNESVEGSLEILQGGRIAYTIEQTRYTIHFTAGTGEMGPRPQIFIGEEADDAQARFERERMAYEENVRRYTQAHEEWLALAREAQRAGNNTVLPPAPAPPPAYDVYSTGLNAGYPVALPPGTYGIRTRMPSGAIVPGSERSLVVFSPRRTAVGYRVVPESRWTFPEQLNDPSDMILGEAGSALYLQPQVIREYPEMAYQRLQDPQSPIDSTSTEWEWVAGEPVTDGMLEVVRNNRTINQIPLADYYVKQVPGGEFGYDILPFDSLSAEERGRVDFSGYRIELEETRDYEIRLRAPDGTILVGSEHHVRVVPAVSLPQLFAIPLLPLAVGTLVLIWRRRQLTRLTVSG